VTELTWSPQALRDLEGIRAYIALDSPQYADLTVRRIVAVVDRLQASCIGRGVQEREFLRGTGDRPIMLGCSRRRPVSF
jgi:plasmid stabilization system protein ParE